MKKDFMIEASKQIVDPEIKQAIKTLRISLSCRRALNGKGTVSERDDVELQIHIDLRRLLVLWEKKKEINEDNWCNRRAIRLVLNRARLMKFFMRDISEIVEGALHKL